MLLQNSDFYIGNVKIERTAALAPMASVADRAYRAVCKEFGAAYMVSEMISAKGLCYSDRKTEELCMVHESERPYALQLFGSEPEFMGRAVKKLMAYKPDIIDINMGCPVTKIVSGKSGSALMKDPELAYDIIRSAVLNSDVPVTVKIRSGWDENTVNAVPFAQMAEEAGASAVTVHGRTKNQMYGGKADWDIIGQVKKAVSIPVIGNGDVTSAGDAVKMYGDTNCDLVMTGRGSFGRPWIFRQTEHYIKTGVILPEPPLKERLEIMLRQTELAVRFKGERTAMAESRMKCAFYLKGIPNAAALRNECSKLSSLTELRELIKRILY